MRHTDRLLNFIKQLLWDIFQKKKKRNKTKNKKSHTHTIQTFTQLQIDDNCCLIKGKLVNFKVRVDNTVIYYCRLSTYRMIYENAEHCMGSVKWAPLPSRAYDIYHSIHGHSFDIWGSIHGRKLKHSCLFWAVCRTAAQKRKYISIAQVLRNMPIKKVPSPQLLLS